jgi:hypothetical protein
MQRYLRAGRALALAALMLGGAASLPVAMAPPAFAAAHAYTWSLTCSGEGVCTVTWNWTQNGTVIANPTSGSTVYNGSFNFVGPGAITLSSSGATNQYVQPDTANGITATLQACAGTQCDTQTSTQSFAPGSSVSVSLSASAKANSPSQCFPGYPCHNTKIEEAAAFSLNS